jgi:hypothetical protein
MKNSYLFHKIKKNDGLGIHSPTVMAHIHTHTHVHMYVSRLPNTCIYMYIHTKYPHMLKIEQSNRTTADAVISVSVSVSVSVMPSIDIYASPGYGDVIDRANADAVIPSIDVLPFS